MEHLIQPTGTALPKLIFIQIPAGTTSRKAAKRATSSVSIPQCKESRMNILSQSVADSQPPNHALAADRKKLRPLKSPLDI